MQGKTRIDTAAEDCDKQHNESTNKHLDEVKAIQDIEPTILRIKQVEKGHAFTA